MRDVEFEVDPYWQAAHEQVNKPPSRASNVMLAGLVTGLLGAMFVARIWFPDSGAGMGASPLARTAPTTTPESATDERQRLAGRDDSGISGWLQRRLPGKKPLEAKLDFSRQDGDWIGAAAGWSRRDGSLHPGTLRLWKPTLEAKDYEMEFQAAIQKRGVSWVYRAKDTQSYYATKILITGPSQSANASIVRYGMEGSRVFAKVELPLPTSLQRDKNYRITLLAAGNRFTTLIDGHVVDEWSDSRLKSGGVGFFADSGEAAGISWASFRETKGLLSGLVSATLFLPPGMLY